MYVCEIRAYSRGVHVGYVRKLQDTVNERPEYVCSFFILSFCLTEILFTVCHRLTAMAKRPSVLYRDTRLIWIDDI